ncbi:MAG: hypothetical protein QG608_1028, partial [Actinomycetota bacterium]|nr:hypothetical protein [Actinomycetota bacterium]
MAPIDSDPDDGPLPAGSRPVPAARFRTALATVLTAALCSAALCSAALCSAALCSAAPCSETLVGFGAAHAAGPRPPGKQTFTSPVTIFGSSVPRSPADRDTSAVRLAVRFSSTEDGLVSAVRFWATSSNTGPRTVRMFDGNGNTLATALSKTGTAGWRSVRLPSPVEVRAGRTYLAAYDAPRGRYAADNGYFDGGAVRNNGPLTADAGLYTYDTRGTKAPDLAWQGTNYFVDVVFTPADLGPSPSVSPSPGVSPSVSGGCGGDPGRCGFPDAVSTGVREGVVL